jgi:hypothetical protein
MENTENRVLEELDACVELLKCATWLAKRIELKLRALKAAEDFKDEPITE